jgi:hypothetical protein
MKMKGLSILFSVSLAIVAGIVYPQLVRSRPFVDGTFCMNAQCHILQDLQSSHADCNVCHDADALPPTVFTNTCSQIGCHPSAGRQGNCELVRFHDDLPDEDKTVTYLDTGLFCIECHLNCELGAPTTTTTAANPICPLTQIYGEGSQEVKMLRLVRDSVLSATPEGREMVKLYYWLSPAIMMAIQSDEALKAEIKELVDGFLSLMGQ